LCAATVVAAEEAHVDVMLACPKCGSRDVKPVTWTLWGGALGPRLLNHTRCSNCGTTYNGKSGRPNTNAIVLYNVVIVLIACGCLAACVTFAVLAQSGRF
jgi:hypothetical protein